MTVATPWSWLSPGDVPIAGQQIFTANSAGSNWAVARKGGSASGSRSGWVATHGVPVHTGITPSRSLQIDVRGTADLKGRGGGHVMT